VCGFSGLAHGISLEYIKGLFGLLRRHCIVRTIPWQVKDKRGCGIYGGYGIGENYSLSSEK
jgi:hypothetical protein